MIQKFRAWDKENKRWMTPEIENNEESELRLDIWGNLYFKKPWFEQELGSVTIVDGSKMFDIMQSTGLKDKNCQEIFEGDILTLKYPRDRRYTVTAKVIRGSQISAMVLKFEDEFTTEEIPLYKISAEHNFEVLGNIYENPELLEVAE